MKRLSVITVALCIGVLVGAEAFADVVVLQPGPADGKDTDAFANSPDTNYGNEQRVRVLHHENENNWGIVSYLQFDLSPVPAGAAIASAKMSLDMYSSYNTYNNTVTVRRVTEDWTEGGVTWNNRPARDATTHASRVVHYDDSGWLDWDVTGLVQSWQAGDHPNQGLLLAGTQSANSAYSLRSSDYTGDTSRRPKLEIEYLPGKVIIQPGPEGKDTYAHASNPTTSYGNSPELDVLHHENSNTWGLVSYLQFDLSDVPANADVGSAKLVLDMYSSYNQFDNTVTVRRVTSEWTEDGVTWDNRPTRDDTIQGSRVVHWDDRGPLEWDITGLVTDWHTGRHTNQGMLVAGTTTANSGYYFRSGDYTGGASERPKLVLDFIPAPTYNPLGLEVRQTRYSDWHGFQPDDTLQTLYQAGQATIAVSSFQWGSTNGVADAASPTNLGGTLGVPIDSQPTGDIDMTFPTTDLGWTLEDIAVHVYNAGDARRYYDFDLLYSTVDDPAAFLLFLTVADATAPPSIGTTIAIDLDEGDIQNLHTLRLHARHPWGSQSTSWAEIDVNAHPTPEPATCLLLAAGLLGLARRRRRPA